MFGNRRMPNGMSEEAQSRGHAVWEGHPAKGPSTRLEERALRAGHLNALKKLLPFSFEFLGRLFLIS